MGTLLLRGFDKMNWYNGENFLLKREFFKLLSKGSNKWNSIIIKIHRLFFVQIIDHVQIIQ